MMKKIFLFIIIVLIISPLSGCVFDPASSVYKGNNIELQVIATNSLLGVPGRYADKVIVLETDNFGRKLFAYTTFDGHYSILGILISQKTTKNNSYFYDNENFIFCKIPNEAILDEDLVSNYFNDEQLNQLKELNDWNKPLVEEKMFEITIRNYKKDTISFENQEKVFLTITTNYGNLSSTLLTTDKNGKSIYFMHGAKPDKTKQIDVYTTKAYIIMFNEDGTVDPKIGIEEVNDIFDYKEQLKEFKIANNWAFS